MTIRNIIITLVIGVIAGFGGGSLYARSQPTPKAGGLGAIITGVASSTFATVTTSNTLLIATSTSRQYCAAVNDGANPVYLAIGKPAVVGSGILITANGGSYEINDQNLFTGAIYSIASGGSSNVTTLCK